MKVGIVGKGGVGKTTVAALLSRACAGHGLRVLGVDTDSNPNLGLSLGLDTAAVDAMPPLPRSVMLGAGADQDAGGLITEFGYPTPAGVTLLSALRVTEAGAGCTCSGHATVRSLLGEALNNHADLAVIDMEAGLEHLSRSGGTLAHADILLVVCEPTRKSIITASRTATLADELGLRRVLAVGNKARDDADGDFLRESCAVEGLELVAVFPHDDAVTEGDRGAVGSLPPLPPALRAPMSQLLDALGLPQDAAAGAGSAPAVIRPAGQPTRGAP